jgi:hypothetical protein
MHPELTASQVLGFGLVKVWTGRKQSGALSIDCRKLRASELQ